MLFAKHADVFHPPRKGAKPPSELPKYFFNRLRDTGI